MRHDAETSGALALSPRPSTGACTAPAGSGSRRAPGALEPAQPAEIAQARIFERLLHAEQAELEQHAQRIVRAGDRRIGSGVAEPGDDLAQIRGRIDEIGSLLRALRGRFPDTEPALGS